MSIKLLNMSYLRTFEQFLSIKKELLSIIKIPTEVDRWNLYVPARSSQESKFFVNKRIKKYGSGSSVSDLDRMYEEVCVAFSWSEGDLYLNKWFMELSEQEMIHLNKDRGGIKNLLIIKDSLYLAEVIVFRTGERIMGILKLDDKHTTIAKHYLREQAIKKEHPMLLQIYCFAKIRDTKRLVTNKVKNTFMSKTGKRNYNYIKRTGTTD